MNSLQTEERPKPPALKGLAAYSLVAGCVLLPLLMMCMVLAILDPALGWLRTAARSARCWMEGAMDRAALWSQRRFLNKENGQ